MRKNLGNVCTQNQMHKSTCRIDTHSKYIRRVRVGGLRIVPWSLLRPKNGMNFVTDGVLYCHYCIFLSLSTSTLYLEVTHYACLSSIDDG